jgi:RNA polymerase sigma-70 factor, ECF subfamily
MSATHEQTLIEKCRNGEAAAFGPLMKIYRKQLFSYLLRLSGNREDAEDIFQETLVKTWKGIRKYSNRQKFSSWLFAIAHNAAMDKLRKRNKEKMISKIEPDELHHSSDPHKELIGKEIRTKIEKAVEFLPFKQKEVFLLRINSGMSFKEIAQTTNEPLNTVLSHMHYSVKKIKSLLWRENE